MSENGKIILGREGILAAKRKTQAVEVPELGGAVLLQQLSYRQIENISRDAIEQLALTIVDEEGNRLFATKEEVDSLRDLSSTAITQLMSAATRLNGVSQAAIDETIKNLQAAPSGASASG